MAADTTAVVGSVFISSSSSCSSEVLVVAVAEGVVLVVVPPPEPCRNFLRPKLLPDRDKQSDKKGFPLYDLEKKKICQERHKFYTRFSLPFLASIFRFLDELFV